jgi:hypothetical protein
MSQPCLFEPNLPSRKQHIDKLDAFLTKYLGIEVPPDGVTKDIRKEIAIRSYYEKVSIHKTPTEMLDQANVLYFTYVTKGKLPLARIITRVNEKKNIVTEVIRL